VKLKSDKGRQSRQARHALT